MKEFLTELEIEGSTLGPLEKPASSGNRRYSGYAVA